MVAVGEYIGHVNLSVIFDFLLLYLIKGGNDGTLTNNRQHFDTLDLWLL